MSRTHSSLIAVFEAYGDDAEGGLEALANTDPDCWSAYVDGAAVHRYKTQYGAYVRSLKKVINKSDVSDSKGQARLFDVKNSPKMIEVREMLRLDGQLYRLDALAGAEGASILRRVAERDMKPSKTTISRCRRQLKLADHLEAETIRLGRDVSVAEVLTFVSAA